MEFLHSLRCDIVVEFGTDDSLDESLLELGARIYKVDSFVSSCEVRLDIESQLLRQLSLVRYLCGGVCGGIGTLSEEFCVVCPQKLRLSDVCVVLIGLSVGAENVLEALCGSVVGLGYVPQVGSGHARVRVLYLDEECTSQIQCLGYGLVRGVDTLRGDLHVASPVSLDVFGVNVVMLGSGTSVLCGLLQGGGVLSSPYLSGALFGGSVRMQSAQCSRRNLLRKSR
jgi:hypothetical protein